MISWLRRTHGPLSADLEQVPGGDGLGMVPRRLAPEATVTSVCGYCSTGCGLALHLDRKQGGRAVNLTPATDYPVNRGAACPKGWEALAPLASADRATTPLAKNRRGRLEPVSWERAMQIFVDRFRAIQREHGPESVAFLGTGQIPSEELAFLGSLAKFGLGMVHGDGNTRQCMATAVTAYKQSFGFDAPPYTYADFEESDVIVLWGSNLCIAHPILWQRVCKNRRRPEIVVVDPRTTETAMAATLHARLRPQSDLVLAYGIANIIVQRGRVDRAFVRDHTAGFDEFAAHVAGFPLERVTTETGLAAETVERMARAIGGGGRVSLWWTMGVNQSHQGVRTAQALIALALMTGNIGRPGTGANSITGQCNAMGSRLFSNTSNLLGGRDFESAADRAEVARLLGIDEVRIPRRPSWSYDQILEGALAGRIRGLWIVATNTSHSWINQNDLRAVFDALDFVVVQDMYATTETAKVADLVLPAAGWGEKEGTFINSERRIGRVRRATPSPGQALADFSIFRLVAEAWGCGSMFEGWTSPEAVFRLLARLTAGRPCDFSAVRDYRALDECGGIQWPYRGAAGEDADERRLFEDGRFFHPDGRARFLFDEPRPAPERPSSRYPFVLLTGRGSSSQWHTLTRTAKSKLLAALAPREVYVEIHRDDARALGIHPGEAVVVASQRGSIRARAHITYGVQPGQVFVPMHYPETNRLTFPAFDPYSRQPAYKACAVDLRRIRS